MRYQDTQPETNLEDNLLSLFPCGMKSTLSPNYVIGRLNP